MKLTTEQFLDYELNAGINADNPAFHELARLSIAELKEYNIQSVMDFGAGTGVYSQAAHLAGYEVSVYDIWKSHRDYIKQYFPHLKQIRKVKTTDAMLFIEVAEHMTDEELTKLMDSIKPRVILFSSIPYKNPIFDAEWGHINIKPEAAWDEFFSRYGYAVSKLVKYPTEWARVYQKII